MSMEGSEFAIGGWLPGEGPNRNSIGALLVGAHDEQGRLKFCGPVGPAGPVGPSPNGRRRRVPRATRTPMTPILEGVRVTMCTSSRPAYWLCRSPTIADALSGRRERADVDLQAVGLLANL